MQPLPAPPSAARQRHCDARLRDACVGLLKHDDRVRGLRVAAEVDGGVVHLTGDVDEPGELAALRALVGSLAGVHAVWDRVRVAGRAPVALDLGCGDQRQYSDNLGVDRRRSASVAVQADLSGSLSGSPSGSLSGALPFRTGSVDRIYVVHLLEHLLDYLPLVDECHRVLAPGGLLHVLGPWWRHVNAVADPTHVRYLDVQTIKGICARPGASRCWRPLHASCDGATVFADLTPTVEGSSSDELARFFD